jgi:hypothetical protein
MKIVDQTPKHLRCTLGACPSVHQHGGQLVIIGKKPSAEIMAELGHRVGEDEDIIMIGKEYFADAFGPELPLGGEDGGALPGTKRVLAADCFT